MDGLPSAAVQAVPNAFPLSDGQVLEAPEQTSASSHAPVAARQTVPWAANWQAASQQRSWLEHCLPAFSLHVVQSQHGSVVAEPQSHCSP